MSNHLNQSIVDVECPTLNVNGTYITVIFEGVPYLYIGKQAFLFVITFVFEIVKIILKKENY